MASIENLYRKYTRKHIDSNTNSIITTPWVFHPTQGKTAIRIFVPPKGTSVISASSPHSTSPQCTGDGGRLSVIKEPSQNPHEGMRRALTWPGRLVWGENRGVWDECIWIWEAECSNVNENEFRSSEWGHTRTHTHTHTHTHTRTHTHAYTILNNTSRRTNTNITMCHPNARIQTSQCVTQRARVGPTSTWIEKG